MNTSIQIDSDIPVPVNGTVRTSKQAKGSRQLEFQRALQEKGLCRVCGAKRGLSVAFCDRHLVYYREKNRIKRGLDPKSPEKTNRGRPTIATENDY